MTKILLTYTILSLYNSSIVNGGDLKETLKGKFKQMTDTATVEQVAEPVATEAVEPVEVEENEEVTVDTSDEDENDPSEPESEDKPLTMANLEKKSYGPEELTAGKEYLDKFLTLNPTVHTNFAGKDEAGNQVISWDKFPEEGYNLTIVPLSRSVKGQDKRERYAIAVLAIPMMETVIDAKTGEAFIRKTIEAKLVQQAKTSIGSDDGMPLTVDDFIVAKRGDGSLAVFSTVAQKFLPSLRTIGLKYITQSILRNCLQSASFAKNQYHKVDQAVWVGILGKMATFAESKSLDNEIFTQWANSRDEKEIDEVESIDLSKLEV